jgi:hypothetical protein
MVVFNGSALNPVLCTATLPTDVALCGSLTVIEDQEWQLCEQLYLPMRCFSGKGFM